MNKHSLVIIFCITGGLLVTGCTDETKQSDDKSIKNPVNTYMDSRIEAIDMAKKSLNESNKRTHEQDKIMESLIKP